MTVTDQIGRKLSFTTIPSRVVCCVPSITEYLFDLGLSKEIVGRTKFCIHPKERITSVPKIGGTKNLNFEKIKSLKPDFIIANKEENTKSAIESLMPLCNTYVSDVKNTSDAINMMADLGDIFDKSYEYNQLLNQFDTKKSILKTNPFHAKCVYLIWQNPYMTIGGDTYINSVLSMIGFENINSHQVRYPIVEDLETMVQGSSYILLSTEPYPFQQSDMEIFKKKFPNHTVLLIDGEYMSWYGSRMVKALDYIQSLNLCNL